MNETIDIKHYKMTCRGCQFVNLPEYDNKCPYYSHPKLASFKSVCFFRTYVTVKQLMKTREFINSENSKIPAEIKKYLQIRDLATESRMSEVYSLVDSKDKKL